MGSGGWGHSRLRMRAAVLMILGAGAVSFAPLSPAATTIGQVGPPDTTNCGEDAASTVQVATAAGSPSYSVPPGGGVITSWQHNAATDTTPVKSVNLRLKVFRGTGAANTYLTVGESDVKTLTSGGLKTFPTRIPVQAGDRLGFGQVGLGYSYCIWAGVSGDLLTSSDAAPDPPVGSTVVFPSPFGPYRLNVAATVEPDADGDGFGDETQDGCPSEADTQGGCVPPETTIIKKPKDKTRKKKARFAFTSSEPGSTFQCSLDGEAFAPCASPATEKVKNGKHGFDVQAVDPGGTVDPTPASDSWKVKKKRKKKT